jgi:uncharacterized protein YhdP
MSFKSLSKFFGVLTLIAVILYGASLLAHPFLAAALRQGIPRIEAAATHFLGGQVKFKNVQARMNGLLPEFDLVKVSIGPLQNNQASMQLDADLLTLQLDLVQSFFARSPKFGKITLFGAALVIQPLTNLPGANSKPVHPLWAFPGGTSSPFASVLSIALENTQIKIKDTSIELKNFHSKISFQPTEGSFHTHLQMDLATVSVPSIWRHPTQWEALDLDVKWRPSPNSFHIDQFRVVGEKIHVKGNLDYRFADGYLSAITQFETAEVSSLKKILPTSLLSKNTQLWINTSLQAGQIKSGDLVLAGFPTEWKSLGTFDGKRNHIDFQIKVEKVKLDYASDWPILTQGNGVVLLQDRALKVHFDSANAAKLKLREVEADIRDLTQPELLLFLNLEVKAEAADDVIELIKTGPFRKQAPQILGLGFPTGPVDTSLSLEIPISGAPNEKGSFPFHGAADIHHAALRVLDRFEKQNWDLNLTDIQGRIDFSARELRSENLEARAYGKPSKITFRHERNEGEPISTTVDIDFALPTEKLAAFLPTYPVRQFFAGEIASTLSVKIDHGKTTSDTQTHLKWKSSFLTTEILAPLPFGKAAAEPLSATLSANIQGEELGQVLGTLQRSGPQAFQISALSEKNRTTITGELSEYDLNAWQDWWDKIKSSTPENTSARPPMGIDLHLKNKLIKWKDLTVRDADLRIEKGSDPTTEQGQKSWSVKIRSKEAWGDVDYSFSPKTPKLTGRFKHLVLPYFPWNRAVSPNATPPPLIPSPSPVPIETWKLADWPTLSLQCARLEIEGKDLGVLHAELQQTGQAITSQELSIVGPEMNLNINKATSQYGETAAPFTKIEGTLQLHEAVPPFAFKSMTSAVLSAGQINFKSRWAGGPEQFAFAKAEAHLDGHVKNGKLIGVKSGIQSLFNLFSMNWTDARKQIMRFTKLYFQLDLKKGELTTQIARALFGSIYVKTSGTLGLSTPDSAPLKMEAVVTPSVEEIGDDPAQEVQEAQNFLSHTYKITGTWADPHVGLKVF